MINGNDFVIENGVLTRYTGQGEAVVVPDGVTTIGKRAFCNCKSLTSIHIPDGVTEIGERAFSWCKSLTNIHIPDGVTEIGERAFSGCESLTSIHIPAGAKIGEDAFFGTQIKQ